MTYKRVIPRDLFNEANLLKCLGRLYIATENFVAVDIVHKAPQQFAIDQDISDGSIYCSTVQIRIKGAIWPHRRALNSREPWPLTISNPDDPDADEIDVFTDDGGLSPEFRALLT